ncbi:biopolymer transporter ExbD [candidate division KSB1 bacterium]|nr:MAG: biopolymer transporter ExbD [candidate division KSB1 bacterium]
MEFSRKSKVKAEIPTASLPDIIFMLLIFFMVSTVLKEFTGLQVSLPAAQKIEKIESERHVTYIWISRDNEVCIDDKIISQTNLIRSLMYQKRVADPQVLVALKIDKNARMSKIIDVQQELRQADCLNVNYNTLFKGN